MNSPTQLGKYQIRRELGKGSMGIVYEGFDPHIERTVAVKVLRPGQFDSSMQAELLARFRREAQAAGRLSHPNIVAVYEYAEARPDEKGVAHGSFIAMEFVKGRGLNDFFDKGERFSIAETVRIMGELLDALQHAHDLGVIHRDLKPSNVILMDSGKVKVADFGIARIESLALTQIGTVLGTPSHMSPEQLRGDTADRRTDIFSLGVMLYQFLTGEAPFTGSVTTITQKILNEEPLPPSLLSAGVNREWDMVVKKAMAKDAARRFQTCADFAAAIGSAAGASDDEATVVRRPDRALRRPIARTLALFGIGAGLAATAGYFAFFKLGAQRSGESVAATVATPPPPAASTQAMDLPKPAESMTTRSAAPLPSERVVHQAPPETAAASGPTPASPPNALVAAGQGAVERVAPPPPSRTASIATAASAAALIRRDPVVRRPVETLPRESTTPSPTPTNVATPRDALASFAARDFASARAVCERAANSANSDCQYLLGLMSLRGLVKGQDGTEAFGWLQKAAEQGNAQAQIEVGRMYQKGLGGAAMFQALRWVRKAAEEGNAQAQNTLGMAYQRGNGTQRNAVLAADWYQKSANQGLAVGQYNLACLYLDAKGVFKNTAKARELFEKAAAQGYGDAHYMLGHMYQQGSGVSRDRQMATQWYRSALSKRPLSENHKAHAEKFLASNS